MVKIFQKRGSYFWKRDSQKGRACGPAEPSGYGPDMMFYKYNATSMKLLTESRSVPLYVIVIIIIPLTTDSDITDNQF